MAKKFQIAGLPGWNNSRKPLSLHVLRPNENRPICGNKESERWDVNALDILGILETIPERLCRTCLRMIDREPRYGLPNARCEDCRTALVAHEVCQQTWYPMSKPYFHTCYDGDTWGCRACGSPSIKVSDVDVEQFIGNG